jgi:ribosomal protein L7Ae-like RNA K-turn-binding protein
LSHVLKAPARLAAPAERRRELAAAYGRRLANLLTMARRMRGVKMGPTGARAALAEGRARLVLVAGDADPDAAASWTARAGEVPVRASLEAGALGELFGRGPVAVVAITADGLAASILEATDRWRAFSAVSCDNKGSKTGGASRAARGSAAAGGG